MGRFSRTIVAVGYLLVLTVLAINAMLVYSSLMTITRSNRLVDHSRQVLFQLEYALSILKDAETGQRGYLLTGRDEYLKPFRTAESELEPTLLRLRALTLDKGPQSALTASLERFAAQKMEELRETIALRRDRGPDAAVQVVLTDRGKRLMGEIRRVVAESRDLEDQQLSARAAASQAAVRSTVITFAVTMGLALLLLSVVSYLQRLENLTRERSAAAVRDSEAWLATTLSSIGDGLIATDEWGHVRLINPVAQALTGWSQNEAAGRRTEEVFAIIHEQTRQPVDGPVATVIREGRIVALANHTVLVARDGTERPIDDSAAPIKDDAGKVSGVVLVFRDVTERRQRDGQIAEQVRLAELGRDMGVALTESSTLQEMLRRCAEVTVVHLDAAFARIWTLDEAGAVLELQASAGMYTHIDGLHSRVPLGKYKIGRIAQERCPHLTNAVVGDPAVSAQDWAQREKMVAFAGYPLIVDERLVGVWAMFARHRVSETTLRTMESVARAIALGIEQKQAEAERERLLAAAQAARAEAEEANRAKDQFLAVLSHELRTPLNPILLATTAMLERPTAAEEVRPNLEMIRQNVNLQARLIDDLLDVMRIVRGKMPLHWEVADCHDLIQQAVQICRSEFLGKGLQLTVKLAAARHFINADPARLQQVFWNLIKNSVKFTPSGGTITIQTRNHENDSVRGDRLIVAVTDSGIGIEPELLSKIFDPFQQGESSITRRFGGMGLGLAISKGIIEGHGGLLTAQSQGKDRGTTFTIELQALRSVTAGNDRPSSAAAPVAEPAAPAGLKILIVEDEQTTLRLMARLVRELGHEVTTAGSIGAALKVERSGHFDLIISDIGLPDGSGLELMRQVVARRGRIPAIALTGYGMEEDIQRSRDAGFTAHMTKPIDFVKLQAMIRQVGS